MAEGLSKLYQEVLEGRYDCVDRILLNGYFGLCHSAGGFRLWWRQLTGSDETLDKTHRMRLAGRFSRRLRGYARAHQIPVVDGRPGEGIPGENKNQPRRVSHPGGACPSPGMIDLTEHPFRRLNSTWAKCHESGSQWWLGTAFHHIRQFLLNSQEASLP